MVAHRVESVVLKGNGLVADGLWQNCPSSATCRWAGLASNAVIPACHALVSPLVVSHSSWGHDAMYNVDLQERGGL